MACATPSPKDVRLAALKAWSQLSKGDAAAGDVLRTLVAAEPLAALCQAAAQALASWPGENVNPAVCNSRAVSPGQYERMQAAAFAEVLNTTFPGATLDPGTSVLARQARDALPRLGFFPIQFGWWPDDTDATAHSPNPAILGIAVRNELVSDGAVRLDRSSQGTPGIVAALRIAEDRRILDKTILRLYPAHWDVDIQTIQFAMTDGIEEFGTRWPLVIMWVRQRLSPDSTAVVEGQLICDMEHERCLSEHPSLLMRGGVVVRRFDAATMAARFQATRSPAYAQIVGVMSLAQERRGPMAIVTAADVVGSWGWRRFFTGW